MNYTCWINADDEEIDICEMDNEYIKNCIQCIQKSDYKHFTREDAMKDKEQKIFGPWWCYEHAQNYLDAFNTELSIRKKGKNKIILKLIWKKLVIIVRKIYFVNLTEYVISGN